MKLICYATIACICAALVHEYQRVSGSVLSIHTMKSLIEEFDLRHSLTRLYEQGFIAISWTMPTWYAVRPCTPHDGLMLE